MRKLGILALAAFTIMLAGCREVRVKEFDQGTTTAARASQIVIVRSTRALEELGIRAPINFSHEFGVVLLMGPHRETGYHQVIESIRANANRVRIVAFERPPSGGGAPSSDYHTYTLWVITNAVYQPGSIVDVVTPSGDTVASMTLR
jgi:hypothetical protein